MKIDCCDFFLRNNLFQYADGIVVGSALVERMGRGPEAVRELMMTLRQALDAVGVAR